MGDPFCQQQSDHNKARASLTLVSVCGSLCLSERILNTYMSNIVDIQAREPSTLVLVTRDPDLIRRCDRSVHLGDCHLSRPGHGSELPPRA